jgi:hypothetical protein
LQDAAVARAPATTKGQARALPAAQGRRRPRVPRRAGACREDDGFDARRRRIAAQIGEQLAAGADSEFPEIDRLVGGVRSRRDEIGLGVKAKPHHQGMASPPRALEPLCQRLVPWQLRKRWAVEASRAIAQKSVRTEGSARPARRGVLASPRAIGDAACIVALHSRSFPALSSRGEHAMPFGFRDLLLGLALAALCAGPAEAGRFGGRVHDAAGAPLSGVMVSISPAIRST